MIEFLKHSWYYYAALEVFFLYALIVGLFCLRGHAKSQKVNVEQMLARGVRNEST